jgi:exosortase
MAEVNSSSASLSSSMPSRRPGPLAWSLIGGTAIFLLLWLELVNHLKAEWSLNPQYSYGWLVPLLALFLLWKRWDTRPPAAPPRSVLVPGIIVAGCAFTLLPLRLIAEANPDWRLISWALALDVILISLSAIYFSGGIAWVRHFAFPILFFLVAVPWPAHMEQVLVQTLMQWETAINVAMLNFRGINAVQHGNVIEVGTGLIGIEEACSGVRSLQATFMISLFLGELYEFTVGRRVILVAAGAVLAFVCNLLRTALLVWAGAKDGAKAIEAWHDPAGWTILVVCFFGLWMLSLRLRKSPDKLVRERALPSGPAPHLIPVSLSAIFLVWILLVEAGVLHWYGYNRSATSLEWEVAWPKSASKFETVPIAPEAQTLLRYSDGGGGSWIGPEGHRFTMYFFRWLPGRTAALFVRNHRPDICLPASGMTLRSDSATRINVNNISLPVRSYRFDYRGRPLHVYYCYWGGRTASQTSYSEEDWTASGRLKTAWRGEREIGTQMLELAVWGYEDDNDARAALLRELDKIVRKV